MHDVFIYKLTKEYPEFLKSHQLRKIVFGQIVDRMFQKTTTTGATGTKSEEEAKV